MACLYFCSSSKFCENLREFLCHHQNWTYLSHGSCMYLISNFRKMPTTNYITSEIILHIHPYSDLANSSKVLLFICKCDYVIAESSTIVADLSIPCLLNKSENCNTSNFWMWHNHCNTSIDSCWFRRWVASLFFLMKSLFCFGNWSSCFSDFELI